MSFSNGLAIAILARLECTAKRESRVVNSIVYAALSNCTVTESNKLMATIYIEELSALCGSKTSSLYTRVKNACNREYSGATVYDWCYNDNDEKLRPIICNALYHEGTCTIEFDMQVQELCQTVYKELKESGAVGDENAVEDSCKDIEKLFGSTEGYFFRCLREALE